MINRMRRRREKRSSCEHFWNSFLCSVEHFTEEKFGIEDLEKILALLVCIICCLCICCLLDIMVLSSEWFQWNRTSAVRP